MRLAGTTLWIDVSNRLNLKADKGQSRRQRIAAELRKALKAAGGNNHTDFDLPSAFLWSSTPQGHKFWKAVAKGVFV